jgi:predicted PurR-regulated permease PerM
VTPSPPSTAAESVRPDRSGPTGTEALLTGMVTIVVVAGLYFGRQILVPLAIATLLSFALVAPVRWLRRLHLPRLPAVLAVVTLAFLVIFAFGWIVTWQITDLASRLPRYQQNIEAKIDAFQESPPGGRLTERLSEMLRDIGRKIEENGEETTVEMPAGTGIADPEEAPQPAVVVIDEPDLTPMQMVQTIVGPLIGPLATAGIVIVFVIFMLLKREDLRDRLIRLAGARDLPRTTQALDDAAQRVGHYLLMQLVVNVTYGIPIGVGLWLIGVPNPILWGMLAFVLRFVPYIGPIIAAAFPLALAVAVDPTWTTLLWTAALFIVIEIVSNNAIEPWVYGVSTGLSPVAIIAAAIFWTWLWGPIGLLLSTPLTVCLVVLGRHVPQLAFLDILLGSDPVLTPTETLYQRLLGGDPDEATMRAEELLREQSLASYYDDVAIPALALAERDRVRGALDEEGVARTTESALLLVDNLAEFEESLPAGEESTSEEEEAGEELQAPDPPDQTAPPIATPAEPPVLCVGARGPLDEVAIAMLGQLLERQGIAVRTLSPASLHAARLREIDLDGISVVVLSYVNADSLAHARFLIRRLRRRLPHAKFIVGFWTLTPEDMARRDPAAATGADRVAAALSDAVNDVRDELARHVKEEEKEAPPALALAAGRKR